VLRGRARGRLYPSPSLFIHRSPPWSSWCRTVGRRWPACWARSSRRSTRAPLRSTPYPRRRGPRRHELAEPGTQTRGPCETTPGARVNQQIRHRGPERRPHQWEITNDLSSPANPEIVATKGYLYSPRAENLTRVTSPTFGPFRACPVQN
jgi:hypothetical protein